MCGFYAEHFQLLLGDKDDFAVLAKYLDSITMHMCKMTDDFYDTQGVGRVVPARKGLKNKVRPLVVPDLARKVCECTLCEDLKATFLQSLAPEQHAVGLPAAIEKYAKSVLCLVEATDDAAVGLLDCESAYNHILRDPILEEVEEEYIGVLSFVATFMCRRGKYVFYGEDGGGADKSHHCTPAGQSGSGRRAAARSVVRCSWCRKAVSSLLETTDGAAGQITRICVPK